MSFVVVEQIGNCAGPVHFGFSFCDVIWRRKDVHAPCRSCSHRVQRFAGRSSCHYVLRSAGYSACIYHTLCVIVLFVCLVSAPAGSFSRRLLATESRSPPWSSTSRRIHLTAPISFFGSDADNVRRYCDLCVVIAMFASLSRCLRRNCELCVVTVICAS